MTEEPYIAPPKWVVDDKTYAKWVSMMAFKNKARNAVMEMGPGGGI